MARSGHAQTSGLADVLELSDPLGVVSVYVSARDAATPGNAAMHALEVELARLERTIDSAWASDPEPARAALAWIEQRVRDASLAGGARNQALFAALGHGTTVAVEPGGAVPTRALLGPRADVRPLCAALAEGRPAGVALASAERIRALEWTPGALVEIWTVTVPELEQRDLLGPAHAHPRGLPGTAPGFKSGQQRDLFEGRSRKELERLLAATGEKIARLAAARDWHELALGGEQRLVSALVRGFPGGVQVDIAPVPRIEQWRSLGELAELVAPAIAGARDRRTEQIVRRVLEEVGRGRAALGLHETLDALGEGRVDTLLVPADRPLEGRATAAGALAAPGQVPLGSSEAELVDEPMLADAMIARALAAGATVVVLSAKNAELLGDDAAALLRY